VAGLERRDRAFTGRQVRQAAAVSVASDLNGAVKTTTNDLTKSTGFATHRTKRGGDREEKTRIWLGGRTRNRRWRKAGRGRLPWERRILTPLHDGTGEGEREREEVRRAVAFEDPTVSREGRKG
jgi:hypothetical protein